MPTSAGQKDFGVVLFSGLTIGDTLTGLRTGDAGISGGGSMIFVVWACATLAFSLLYEDSTDGGTTWRTVMTVAATASPDGTYVFEGSASSYANALSRWTIKNTSAGTISGLYDARWFWRGAPQPIGAKTTTSGLGPAFSGLSLQGPQ